MTEKELGQYRNIVKKIEYLQMKIQNETEKEIEKVAIKVTGSSREFPYLETGYTTTGYEPSKTNRRDKRLRKWKTEIEELEKKKERIENYIDGIEDYEVRMILKLKYIDFKSQREIAESLDISQAKVSRKLKMNHHESL